MSNELVNKLFEEYNERSNRDPFKGRPWVIIDLLLPVILSYVPGSVIEIGVGHSTPVLAAHARAFERHFHTCDIRKGRCLWAATQVGGLGVSIHDCKSIDMMDKFDEPVAAGLIDGDHTANSVTKEVAFFFGKLSPGGVLFLHDTTPVPFRYEKKKLEGARIDTYTVRKELEERQDMDVFTWRYTAGECGLSMVMKKDPTAPFYRN